MKRNIQVFVMSIILLLLCTNTLFAYTYSGSLATTDGRSIRRTSCYADVWTFTLSGTVTVQIDMTSSFDNYSILYSGSTPSSSGFIAENDDTNGANARISRSLSAGTYCIEATSYNANATGSYTLTSTVAFLRYSIDLEDDSLLLMMGGTYEIRGVLKRDNQPLPNFAFGVHDGIGQMSFMETTDSLGVFSFITSPLQARPALVEFLIEDEVVTIGFDIVIDNSLETDAIFLSGIEVHNQTDSPITALVNSPFGNELRVHIEPGNTRNVLNTNHSIFSFDPSWSFGGAFHVGAPAAGGTITTTRNMNTGVGKITYTGGALGLLRFSVFTTTDLNYGVCWSPGGQIGAGAGGSIGGSICLGRHSFTIGGSISGGVLTSGFELEILNY